MPKPDPLRSGHDTIEGAGPPSAKPKASPPPELDTTEEPFGHPEADPDRWTRSSRGSSSPAIERQSCAAPPNPWRS